MHAPPARGETPLLVLLTLAALVLRLLTLGEQPLSADEAMHLQGLGILEMLRLDLHVNPPLFRLLVRGMTAISPTPLMARMVPMAAGVATVPILFTLARRRVGLPAATLATVLLVIHPWHIRHSQTLRSYSLLTLLFLMSVTLTWSSGRSEGGPPWRPPVRHALLAILLTSTHYLGFILLMGEIAVLLWQRHWRHGGTVLLAVAASAALWGSAIGAGTAAKLAGSPPYVAGMDFLMDLTVALTCPGGLAYLATWLLAAYGIWRLKPRVPQVLLACATLPVVVLGGFMPIELRYALPALPLLLLLVGAGGQALWHHRPTPRWRTATAILAGLSVLGTGYLLPLYYAAPEAPEAAVLAHRDLVHEATLTGDLVADIADPHVPLVVIGRGQVSHQLLLMTHDNHYPEVVHTMLADGTESFEAPNLTLTFVPAPDAVQPVCPALPEPPFSLLVEAPYPCDLPAHCAPLEPRKGFLTARCSRRVPGPGGGP